MANGAGAPFGAVAVVANDTQVDLVRVCFVDSGERMGCQKRFGSVMSMSLVNMIWRLVWKIAFNPLNQGSLALPLALPQICRVQLFAILCCIIIFPKV